MKHEPRTIVAWPNEGGLPSRSRYAVVEDSTLLFAVVHAIEKTLKTDYYAGGEGTTFLAKWDGEKMNLTLPHVDGDPELFLTVLAKILSCMADFLVQVVWGSGVLENWEKQAAAKQGLEKKILVPTMKIDPRPV